MVFILHLYLLNTPAAQSVTHDTRLCNAVSCSLQSLVHNYIPELAVQTHTFHDANGFKFELGSP